jgi:hypothetical protein
MLKGPIWLYVSSVALIYMHVGQLLFRFQPLDNQDVFGLNPCLGTPGQPRNHIERLVLMSGPDVFYRQSSGLGMCLKGGGKPNMPQNQRLVSCLVKTQDKHTHILCGS